MTKQESNSLDTFFKMIDFIKENSASSFLGGLPDNLKETENELRVMNNNFKLNDLAEKLKEKQEK